MIKGAVIGGGGYTGGELLRLSVFHPHLEIEQVISQSQAGKALHQVHTDLLGDLDLQFESELRQEADVYFLCMGHGKSKAFIEKNPQLSGKIVDLSHDYRIKHPEHGFQYGLPEVYRSKIRESSRIANPGCFATAIQLGLIPLANENLLKEDIHIHAITGSTGAGQTPKPTSHFSWRSNNVSTYKVFEHQHLAEIRQTLAGLQFGEIPAMHFVPVRGAFTRGIYASMYTRYDGSQETLDELYKSCYHEHPFVLITDHNPDLKQVVNTNKCLIYARKKEGYIYIVSIIDNLLKGAVGQAIQNMNLCFGLEEEAGLKFKSSVF